MLGARVMCVVWVCRYVNVHSANNSGFYLLAMRVEVKGYFVSSSNLPAESVVWCVTVCGNAGVCIICKYKGEELPSGRCTLMVLRQKLCELVQIYVCGEV